MRVLLIVLALITPLLAAEEPRFEWGAGAAYVVEDSVKYPPTGDTDFPPALLHFRGTVEVAVSTDWSRDMRAGARLQVQGMTGTGLGTSEDPEAFVYRSYTGLELPLTAYVEWGGGVKITPFLGIVFVKEGRSGATAGVRLSYSGLYCEGSLRPSQQPLLRPGLCLGVGYSSTWVKELRALNDLLSGARN